MDEFIQSTFSSVMPLVASLGSVVGVSLDIAIVGGLFFVVFLYAFFSSKKAVLASLFALIFAGFIFLMFPYWGFIEAEPQTSGVEKDILLRAGIFIGLFFAIRLAIRHSVRGSYRAERTHKFVEAGGLALAATALILMYGYRFTSLSELYPLSPEITWFLISPTAFFWWLVGAFGVVYLFSQDY